MKTAIQNLEEDHLQILRLIKVMERITQLENPDEVHLELIIKVIREFADVQHHAKEEQLLFPLLVEKGLPNESGPVAVMLHDHQQGRLFVKGMVENMLLMKTGDLCAFQDIYTNMLGYTELLKSHIAKENNVLFRMADKVLTNTEQERLLLEFAVVENETKTGRSKDDYFAMVDDLTRIYLP